MARLVQEVGVNVDFRRNFIRGPLGSSIADMTTPFATRLSDVIRTTTASNANEVQSVAITGTPTGGTFTLSFKGYTTPPLAYNATRHRSRPRCRRCRSIGTGGVDGHRRSRAGDAVGGHVHRPARLPGRAAADGLGDGPDRRHDADW
jgi:hypothetical protein